MYAKRDMFRQTRRKLLSVTVVRGRAGRYVSGEFKLWARSWSALREDARSELVGRR
jgi:hypothetical protein